MRKKLVSRDWQKQRVVQSILKDVRDDLHDDALVHRICMKKYPRTQPCSTRHWDNAPQINWLPLPAVGFLLTFVVLLLGWMIFNAVMAARAFDPYPYILLNLVLSCLSAIQAPILMMSQNRQGEKDRLRAENDFQVNLKTEFIIEDLHHKLEEALMGQQELHEALEALTVKIERSGGSHETDVPSL
ncbi:MAG: DUF1003 domain-containing protein [Christensenellales bacterium]